ncbi:Mitochondrial import inner membrane translocase subunit TIM17-2 [Abeliophyllum distichum]|uniref:Mitochondrial import inner membrane translocase subunit TIM17-2 n=1 Tax=Abeliophyllum distichum TaxID=126358 RepID=A0ABD1TFH9_9LAMI
MPTCFETCSDISLDDMGAVLASSAVIGSTFQFFKGIYNSPKGQRLIGSTQAVRRNGLRSGGIFAVWFDLSCVLECSIDHVRQKEDPRNGIFSTAAAAGFLHMRKGLGPRFTLVSLRWRCWGPCMLFAHT